MPQHRSSAAPLGVPTSAREHRTLTPDELDAAEITDIIPFSAFEELDDCSDRESSVIYAPELDDLNDTDDLVPVRLAVPSRFRPEAGDGRSSRYAYRDSHTDVSDGIAATDVINMAGRRGSHRKEAAGAVKSRLMIAAMAAGATAAGAYSLGQGTQTQADDTILASEGTRVDGAAITGSVDGMQIVSVSSTADSAVHAEEITKAAAFAQERAEREARLSRPLFVMPTKGYVWTSNFGYRWGVLHAGIDLASPIGTPISAVSDGVVIAAGPTAGYGAWVKLRHSDGTVTLYGHINTWLVSVGDRVMAGDQIATVGNRGNSTGPHLHFEVLPDGSSRIDPVPWLAKRGLSLGSYVG
ncbi:murein DD-endopeptidase MepM/ murein hydrolase activator NlpD [Mycobacterium frederiksbergense]|uniref:Murein DD-endopeptidase MepM/ murein hydrolase activator NlpD n=1 Tax=Mycolicibacterium frederiksbergense TaxID=117567 RepID=A0ABT6L833_9MYCO|nr:M23 family metallopeptidase [Mycolicibacterium frederiksbergense]MDH6199117.1 murein DD-endopeptidase MepM/ murein hydrolase activator NlpD [Mycolicibacterium frederiksbergense]